MTGYLKRTSMKEAPEEMVLLRALRDMNLPKFILDDVALFLALIEDLFPNVHCPRTHYDDLNRAVQDVLTGQHYILIPDQIDKIVQLYETMMTRHSTMLVGPTR